MGRKRTLVIYRVLLIIIQQNIDEHICVRKLSQTGQGPSKRTRTMPGVTTGPRIVPVSNSLSGIPHKECGMSQSDRIASLPWDKN